MSEQRRPVRSFLPLYALANAGAVIAYVPLLGLLLPMKIEAIAPSARIEVLSLTAIVGAVVASVANIGFGMASDRTARRRGSRRGWIVGGVATLICSYVALAVAMAPAAVVWAIVLFQVAVNMILAPLGAMMADNVAEEDMGVAGGALALATPAGSIAAALLTGSLLSLAECLAVLAVVVPLLVAPLLSLRPTPLIYRSASRPPYGADNLVRLSVARLFVQTASATLFTYLLFYFETLTKAPGLPPRIALLTMAAFVLSFPLGVGIGRWSDRSARRRPFLAGTALMAASALVVMALAANATTAAVGYSIFAGSSTIFLSLQAAYAMQILPSPDHRGRDLGFVNLANTLPIFISSGLAFGIVGRFGFGPLLLILSVLVLVGCGLTLTVRIPPRSDGI